MQLYVFIVFHGEVDRLLFQECLTPILAAAASWQLRARFLKIKLF